MDRIKDLLSKTEARGSLGYDQLPDIDLYMDQVIEYLSRSSISTRESDKISSAMINNYIKDGILPRANGKKYSKQHLAYLIMISGLKQTLSVKDTGALLRAELKDKEISSYFDGFMAELSDAAAELERALPEKEEELSAFAMRLAISGYLNRALCEAILSRLEPDEPDGEKAQVRKEKGKDKEKVDSDKKQSKKKESKKADKPRSEKGEKKER